MYIYKITNLINGKIYIGQRTQSPRCDNYYGSGIVLRSAIKKYGKENFNKETLEDKLQADQLNEREIYWIKKLKSRDIYGNYNLTDGGDGTTGYKHTEEDNTKNIKSRVISIYQYDLELNIIKKWYSIAEASRFYSIKDTNVIKCLKGKLLTCHKFHWSYTPLSTQQKDEIKYKIKKRFYKGAPHSEETKKKISENAKINPNYGMKGKHHSEETKEKIRQSNIRTKKLKKEE